MLPSRLGKAGLILSAAVFCPAQTEPPEADILVIARKMRTVRLSYTLAGRHLKICEPVVSSGDARIDRIMCAVLRQCAASGETEVTSAKACVNDRIAMLEEAPAVATGGLPQDQPAPVQLAPPPGIDLPVQDELVVTARRLPVLPGRWHFSQSVIVTGSPRGAFASCPESWRLCIPKDALLSTLGTMLADPPSRRQPTYCHDWNLEIAEGRIDGKMRCMLPGIRLTGTLEGTISSTQISVSKQQLMNVINTKSRGWKLILLHPRTGKVDSYRGQAHRRLPPRLITALLFLRGKVERHRYLRGEALAAVAVADIEAGTGDGRGAADPAGRTVA